MKIDVHKYNFIFGENIKRRFEKVRSVSIEKSNKGFDAEGNFELTECWDWHYQGIEFKANFYVNDQKRLRFFAELGFERKNGLKERIEKLINGSKIEKSTFLNKPQRIYIRGEDILKGPEQGGYGKSYFENYLLFLVSETRKAGSEEGYSSRFVVRPDTDYYFMSSRIKKPASKLPENPNIVIDNIFGMLLSKPYGEIIKRN